MSTSDKLVPAVELSAMRLEQLIRAWNNGEPTAFPALGDTALRGISMYAHVDHLVRLASAVSMLTSSGLYLESVPLIRMMLECSVTAAWLSVTPDSGDSSLREATRLKRAFIGGVGAATSAEFDAELAVLQRDLEGLEEFSSREASSFEDRCKSLQGGDWLYVVYRELSAFSHAGALLLDHYIQEDSGPLGFSYVSDQDADRAAVDIATAVWVLHLGLTAWDALLPESARTLTLQDVANDCGFSTQIKRAT